MLAEILEKMLKLVDWENKEVKTFDFHGAEYEVVKILSKDEVLAIGPDGEEDVFDVEEIKSQDDTIKGVK